MLRNVIFDMGNVLMRYDPDLFLDRTGITDPDTRDLLMGAIFHSPNWARLDSGEWTEGDLDRFVKTILPESLHAVAHDLIWHWDRDMVMIDGMAELVRDCAAAGMGVYLLSNASLRAREYWNRVAGSEYFTGTCFSAEIKCAKPDPEAYRHMLTTYHLIAEECLFADDMQYNADGATAVGMRGYRFDGDAQRLRAVIFAEQ